ncbi:MAG: hypothetical protein H7Y38_12060 [Armatimonadetes bacterium]|nr:hypothetical protein [Armatimonadota bacterium]
MFRAIRFFAGMALHFAGVATARAQGAAGNAAPASGVGALWETIAHGVINPWITILLLFAGCFLLFVDLLTPKTWEWMGTLGVLAVGVVFAAHVSEGTGGWVGVVLMLVGVGLLLLETHVFPGGGVAAIGGLLALSLGMFTALGGTHNTVFALPVAGALTIVAIVAFFAYLPKSPLWKQITREMRQANIGSFDTAAPAVILPGQTGTTLTALRPSGMAELSDGTRLNVITEGDFLEANASVQVTHVDGGRIVVEPVQGAITSGAPLIAIEQ